MDTDDQLGEDPAAGSPLLTAARRRQHDNGSERCTARGVDQAEQPRLNFLVLLPVEQSVEVRCAVLA